MNYETLAREIITLIGGEQNVQSFMHCATRLRFVLKDEGLIQQEALEKLDGVIKAMPSIGQYHVVIGNAVTDVYDTINSMYAFQNTTPSNKQEQVSEKKKSLIGRLMDVIIGVMVPIISIMSATGIIKGVLALLTSVGWMSTTSGTYQILYAIADVIFNFMPIYVGYSAAKKFGSNDLVGMAIGAVFFYPTFATLMASEPIGMFMAGTPIEMPIYTTFFGIPVLLNSYSATIIPAILSVLFASKIEKVAKKYTHAAIASFVVPLITLLISIPVAIILIGPVSIVLSQLIGSCIMSAYEISPTLISAVLGGLWIPIVTMGIHGAIVPIAITNFFTNGFDVIFPMITGHSFAIAGAVLAIAVRNKNVKQKALAYSAGFNAGIMGVIEPALYGFILKEKKILIMSCLVSGIGGGFIGFFQCKLVTLTPGGIFALPGFLINGLPGLQVGFIVILLVIVLSTILGFVFTMMLYRPENEK